MSRLLVGCALLLVLTSFVMDVPAQAPAGAWGGLKGQVVFGGDKIPEPVKVVVGNNPGCLAKGPIFGEEYVIDKDTKGVKWVMVWLVDPAKKALPVHPKLAVPPKTVSFDQPCCTFEPHVLFVQQGQTVEVKNSAVFPHNVNINGGLSNPSINVVIPAGKSELVNGWKATTTPVPVACNIHPWMKMTIRVVDHPYFAVTDDKGNFEIKDAPAGKWNLVAWHEGKGWGAGGKAGVPVEVVAGKVTDLGTSKVE